METSTTSGVLNKLFASCAGDPKGSVHRAWGLSLMFILLLFIVSFFEMANLQKSDGSQALTVAAIWMGVMHVLLGILGTFVLKRFPTNFAVGCFLGWTLVTAHQNLITSVVFRGYSYGRPSTNVIFASLGFMVFLVLTFFTLILFHFKADIVVAPIDAKGLGRKKEGETADDYQEMS